MLTNQQSSGSGLQYWTSANLQIKYLQLLSISAATIITTKELSCKTQKMLWRSCWNSPTHSMLMLLAHLSCFLEILIEPMKLLALLLVQEVLLKPYPQSCHLQDFTEVGVFSTVILLKHHIALFDEVVFVMLQGTHIQRS